MFMLVKIPLVSQHGFSVSFPSPPLPRGVQRRLVGRDIGGRTHVMMKPMCLMLFHSITMNPSSYISSHQPPLTERMRCMCWSVSILHSTMLRSQVNSIVFTASQTATVKTGSSASSCSCLKTPSQSPETLRCYTHTHTT